MGNRRGVILVRRPVPTPRDPTPSPDDIAITKQLIQAGALLDIDLMDHLIIGHARWCSMRERHLIRDNYFCRW